MARVPRLRHLRYRAKNVASTRLRRLLSWLGVIDDNLDGTGTSANFVPSAAQDTLTITDHGYQTGDGPFVVSSTNTLPAGLTADTNYWANVVDTDTITLHGSYFGAFRDEEKVDITDTGTGTHSIVPEVSDQALVEHVRQGENTYNLNTETDIDNLF